MRETMDYINGPFGIVHNFIIDSTGKIICHGSRKLNVQRQSL